MKKSTIIIIIVVAAAALVFLYFQGSILPSSETLEADAHPEVQASATRVLGLLNQIKSLKIDGSIFKSAEYQTLQDYSVAIPPLEVGRINPFAPVQGAPARTTTTGSGTTGTRR